MFLSYEYDVASGAAIVLLSAAVFGAVYVGTGLWKVIVTGRERFPAGQPATSPQATASFTRVPMPATASEDHLFD
jgi:hypothetical protein